MVKNNISIKNFHHHHQKTRLDQINYFDFLIKYHNLQFCILGNTPKYNQDELSIIKFFLIINFRKLTPIKSKYSIFDFH